MKIQYLCALVLFCMLSAACLAQRPSPVVADSISASDVSVNFLLPVKDLGLSHYGQGAELSASHYLTNHLGVQIEGDYLRTNYLALRNGGVRVGGILRIHRAAGLQPYVHALVGYSWMQDTSLRPATSYHGSPSLLGGVGVDFRIVGSWYGRAGADAQYDWSNRTRVGRGVGGISYHF